MKKIISLILISVIFALSLFACAPVDNTTINLGFMSGPTGMGLAKLIEDNGGLTGNENYTFTPFDNSTMAVTKLKNGEVDMICLPTNEAANLYTNGSDDISVLAINTLGTLFLLSNEEHTFNSLSDLEGHTIYTCKNGTPRVLLEKLLDELGINATVSYTIGETEMAAPKDLAAQVLKGNIDIAVAPEPIVSKILSKKTNFSVDVNMSVEWENAFDSPMAMGCIVASNKFIDEHKSLVNNFLNEYKASIEYISNAQNKDTSAKLIAKAGISESESEALSALSNIGSSISYIDGNEMKSVLIDFYNAIALSLPDEKFYYGK